MNKLWNRMKYFWHILKFNQLSKSIQNNMDQGKKEQLQYKKEYHEKAALQRMFKH